jgi:HSP20 family protein
MAIVRHTTRMPVFTSPWRELDDLFTNRLSRLVDEGWSGITQPPAGDWIPAVNVDETKDELVLTAELPGLSEEDVEIELENNILTIKGEKMEETREDEARVHLFERRYGSFLRSFTLPRTVNAEGIEARFRDGVLVINMPKVAEAKGRKIAVKRET